MLGFEYFFIGLILSIVIFKLISPFLKNHFLINPIKISSHKKPTPSGAGLSFVISTLFIAIFNGYINDFSFVEKFIIISALLSLVGILDDYLFLSRKFRFFMQILVVSLIIYVSPYSGVGLFLFFLICFFGVSVINLINFTDGIDGLLGGSILVALTGANLYLSISPLLNSLTAGLIIFLFLNWYPSKFFMGDAGSLFLGSIYFSVILTANSYVEMFRIFLLITPLLADSIICILRRFILKENIFRGHKKHLYQRLVRAGYSHSKVSLIYIGSTFLLVLINNFLNFYMLIVGSILIVAFGFYINRYAVKFIPNHE